ncbi:M48 family metalloprotease [Candidatus Babeliales bacterium]|nr:M48 family metalloprotease [Candidatus Babeliales bacterium]MBP9843332.1 M48 family metalloprotease [Candidatus Babeliales bacterium]
MNIKSLRILATIVVGFNVIQTPVQATVLNTSPTFPTSLNSTTLGSALALYIGYNTLTRKSFLVSEKFKEAQAWYDFVAAKYPQAGLENMVFIQTPKDDWISDTLAGFAKKLSWTSSYNHIYFTKDTLKEINHLYKKVVDGYPLDAKEAGKLAGHEFTLLHEAGHIKNNDAQNLVACVFGLLGATKLVADYQGENLFQTEDYVLSKGTKILGVEIGKIAIPGTLTQVSTASFMAALTTILRYQEAHADKFAIETADLQALKNALKIFENDEKDALYDLENAQLDPYIESDSYPVLLIQNIVNPIESTIGYAAQQVGLLIKSNKVTRWMYDLKIYGINQGPSVIAQAIKDEIAKREEN